jgi:adenosylhomocysteine nucleosidase
VTILVVFGLDIEWAAWRAHHSFRRMQGLRGSVFETHIGRSLVRAGVVGMGAPRVHDLSEVLCAGDVDVVVASGLAGSLRVECARGAVIVATEVRSQGQEAPIPAASELVNAAVGCGALQVGALLSVDRVIGSAAQKRQLAACGDAVDMETFAVLSEAGRHGVPGAAIRAIGDAADEDLPIDFNRTVRVDGTIDVAALLSEIAAHPTNWPALVPFAFRQRRALRRLAHFLDRFIADLG